MHWRGRSISQPMDKEWKETWAELKKKKKKKKPTLKQCLARRRNKMQRMRTQELIHSTRVKQAPEHAAESDKPVSNGKRMNTRNAMDSYGSRARTQGSGTTYLYPANTGEVGHRSEVRGKRGCGLAVGRKGSLFWGSRLSSFGENVLLGWHPIQKRQT